MTRELCDAAERSCVGKVLMSILKLHLYRKYKQSNDDSTLYIVGSAFYSGQTNKVHILSNKEID